MEATYLRQSAAFPFAPPVAPCPAGPSMAASAPQTFQSQIPVTPPPDHQVFLDGPPPLFPRIFPPHHASMMQSGATVAVADNASHTGSTKAGQLPGNSLPQTPHSSYPPQQQQQQLHHPHTQRPTPDPSSSSCSSSSMLPLGPLPASHPPQDHHPLPPPLTPQPTNVSAAASAAVGSNASAPNRMGAGISAGIGPSHGPGVSSAAAAAAAAAAADPRYVAMASRIAAYYQQRCQAVVNFQQQRCQAWANAQRARCQEMMQAAMLVVAWYIRDRIQRKRRKQRRRFRKGLAKKEKEAAVTTTAAAAGNPRRGATVGRAAGAGRITKGETVRRWVMDVPIGVGGVGTRSELGDEEERAFDIGAAPAPGDKDAHLFSVADGMIKSQLARIDVPLLGALSFDASDSESESSSEGDDDEEMLDEEMEGGEDGDVKKEFEDYEEDDDEEFEYEDDEDMGDIARKEEVTGGTDIKVESDSASKGVHVGTSKGSRNQSTSGLS